MMERSGLRARTAAAADANDAASFNGAGGSSLRLLLGDVSTGFDKFSGW